MEDHQEYQKNIVDFNSHRVRSRERADLGHNRCRKLRPVKFNCRAIEGADSHQYHKNSSRGFDFHEVNQTYVKETVTIGARGSRTALVFFYQQRRVVTSNAMPSTIQWAIHAMKMSALRSHHDCERQGSNPLVLLILIFKEGLSDSICHPL